MLPAWNRVSAVTGAPPKLSDAKSLRPFDVAIMDDSDADTRHAVDGHAILERLTSVWVVRFYHRRGKASTDTLNSMLNLGREHSLSREPSWVRE